MTLRNKVTSAEREPLPTWRVVAPLRCAHPLGSSSHRVCETRAAWMRIPNHGAHALFFCDAHQRPGDRRIPPTFDVRRVSVRLEVVFTGTSCYTAFAHQEAYERLARAVEAAGGLVNLHEIRSDVGHYDPDGAPARPRAAAGKGKG